MSLVSVDSGYQPRVLPNVFSDIPSRDELYAAKRSRASLTLLVILLVGMLIAAGVALFFLYTQQGSPTEMTRLRDANTTLTQRVQSLEQERSQYASQYADVQNLSQRLASIKSLRAQIATYVQEHDWTRTIAERDPTYRRPAWAQQEPAVMQALQTEDNNLTLLLRRLQNTPRPIAAGAPTAPGDISP